MPLSANGSIPASTGRNSGELLHVLRARIQSGSLAPGEFLPTVRRLSEEQGVAHNTAWRALRALEAEGLVAAVPRRGFRVQGTEQSDVSVGTVAYVLSQENIFGGWDLLYRTILDAMEDACRRRGWKLVKMLMKAGDERDVITQLESTGTRSLILDAPSPALLSWARKSGNASVVIDDWQQGLEHDAVIQGNYEGGELAARYLIEKECRKVAWLGRPLDNHHGRARFGGSAAVLAEHGLRFAHTLCKPLETNDLTGLVAKLLTRRDHPDGVICPWRHMALAVTEASRLVKKMPGKDFEMVGWCCEETYEQSYIPMFSGLALPPAVTWSAKDMAETALARLEERHRNRRLPYGLTALPVKLRGS